jgi:hypothetical protein
LGIPLLNDGPGFDALGMASVYEGLYQPVAYALPVLLRGKMYSASLIAQYEAHHSAPHLGHIEKGRVLGAEVAAGRLRPDRGAVLSDHLAVYVRNGRNILLKHAVHGYPKGQQTLLRFVARKA